MHKEIEEAREWSDARPSEFAVHDFKRWCLKGTIHARRLLSLYDRIMQEPVVRINHAGEIPQECKSFISSLDDGPVPSPGTYRRELEDK